MASFFEEYAENLESGGSTSFGKFLGKLGGSLFRWLGVFLGESMSNRDKQYLDYQDELNDENAEVSFQHQKELIENYFTPQAQIISQAKGYEAIGMNKMAMAGTQPGATSASAPQAAAPSGGVSFNPADLLGTILNYKLGQRKLDIEEELLPFRQGELESRSELSLTRSMEIKTLLPSKVENLDASTALFREKINTEQTQQMLNAAGITQKMADSLVSLRQAAILAIDERNRQKFLDSEIALNKANERRAAAASARDRAAVLKIDEETKNLVEERNLMLKEGIRKTLENGQMAHEFTIIAAEAGNIDTKIKQENAGRVVDMVCDGINTVTGVVSTAITGVNASSLRQTAKASTSRAESYRMDVENRIRKQPRRLRF